MAQIPVYVHAQIKDISRNAQGMVLVKMEEKYRGRQVFDSQITVESDPVEQEIVDITGSFVKVNVNFTLSQTHWAEFLSHGEKGNCRLYVYRFYGVKISFGLYSPSRYIVTTCRELIDKIETFVNHRAPTFCSRKLLTE